MGNENSQLKGLEVERNKVNSSHFWNMYFGEKISFDGTLVFVTVFKNEIKDINTQTIWENQTPLNRAIKNLMIYRHPCVLRYLASWQNSKQQVLLTERCIPLKPENLLGSDIQICLGLRDILCALIFLVERANVRHLNLCCSTVYLAHDQTWKLGGFEYVWNNEDVNALLLQKLKNYREKSAIDENEEITQNEIGIEQFSFGALCKEVLQYTQENSSCVTEFLDYCSVHLQHNIAEMRPKLSAILLHPYFTQDFILIYSFFVELPLKSPSQKQFFFTSLVDRLRSFDEINVAQHIGGFLLSRIVLLDQTAQLCVIPLVLCPRIKHTCPSLFSVSTFSQYIIPKLKIIFPVRDAQIRILLLEYFSHFVQYFSHEDLRQHILPNILLGIKDTNEILVSLTLRCLAELVLLLGSSVVIGGARQRFFSNIRPQGLPATSKQWVQPRSITPIIFNNDKTFLNESDDKIDINECCQSFPKKMPERFSPDGGEDLLTDEDEVEIRVESWSDWDLEDNFKSSCEQYKQFSDQKIKTNVTKLTTSNLDKTTDFNELGITDNFTSSVGDIDFFKDMEPTIESSKTSLHLTSNSYMLNEISVDESRFEIKHGDVNEVGWTDADITWN